MRMKRRMVSLIMAVALVLSLIMPTYAIEATPKGYVTVSAEQFTLGLGYAEEPQKVPFYEGESYADVLDRFLGGSSNYVATGSLSKDFYMTKIKTTNATPEVPQFILDELKTTNEALIKVGISKEGFLGTDDYSTKSGWNYFVGNISPSVGCSQLAPKDGEVCRWQFSLNWGADLGNGEWSFYTAANKDSLTQKVAEINSSPDKAKFLENAAVNEAYVNANKTLKNLKSEQTAVDGDLTALTNAVAAMETTPTPTPPPTDGQVQKQLETTLSYMARTTVSPQYFKEWEVMTLARGGYAVPEQYYQGYYDSVAAKATETKGIFDAKKYTENSRVILALSAIGKDAKNVGGYDLTKALADYPSVESQGANGVVYALLALDSNNYAIPTIDDAAKQATRDKYIDYILSKGLSDGGFAFFGSASDVDSTAMVLQSLAPYQSKTAVSAATDKGLDWLSKEQKANGAYQSYESQSCESTAQVIMALTALGIDPKTDKRFIKADGDLFTAISEHYVEGGGFSRTAKGTKINQMSTVQATQGLVAYSRFASGKNSLFDMTDAGGTGSGGGTTDPPTSTTGVSISVPRKISGKQDSILYAVVQLNELPQGKFKLLDGVINIPDELAVEDVVIGSRFDGGKLQYKLDEVEDKLRFVYTNTELNDIIVNGTTFPVDLITIKLKVKTNLSRVDGYKLEISAGGISLKTTSKDAPFIFDTSHSTATSTVTKNGILAKELYAGDGIDVIPANKKAVALEFLNITEAPEITFGNIVLYHSAQLTQKNGTPTYVTLVDKTQAMEDITQFTITEKPSAEIIFGDTNTDKVVNAQDALNVVSAWLRKGEAPTDEKILSMNVNSDARINTVDAMAIMENYINNSELAVLVG